MVELDGDDVRISSRGKLAERDIVQVKPRPCLLHRNADSSPLSPWGSAGLLGRGLAVTEGRSQSLQSHFSRGWALP